MAGGTLTLKQLSEILISYYRNIRVTTGDPIIEAAFIEEVLNNDDAWYRGVGNMSVVVEQLKALPPNSVIITPALGSTQFQIVVDTIPGKVLTSNYPNIPSFQNSGGGVASNDIDGGFPSAVYLISENFDGGVV